MIGVLLIIMQTFTVQTNYNFTHALYHTCEPRMFQHGQRNNQTCKFKFTWLCKTTHDSHTGRFHVCATYSQSCWRVSQDQQLAIHRYLLCGTVISIYEVTQVNTTSALVTICKCPTGVWLYLRLSFTYYYSFDIKLTWFLASFWLCLAH